MCPKQPTNKTNNKRFPAIIVLWILIGLNYCFPVTCLNFTLCSTIYINYTGKLLNGQVFDTTNERLAKDMGIWSSTRNYAPVSIKWGEDYSDITLSGSTVITGFALTLWQMRAFESGVGVFTSDYGYGVSGSGHSIPPYAPLIFEIEIVAKPE